MKKNFLIIITLAGLVSTASAASSVKADSELYVLPAYVVTAPRYQPAELEVNTRLNEIRQDAAMHVASLPAPYLPDLKAVSSETLAHAAKATRAPRLVKS